MKVDGIETTKREVTVSIGPSRALRAIKDLWLSTLPPFEFPAEVQPARGVRALHPDHIDAGYWAITPIDLPVAIRGRRASTAEQARWTALMQVEHLASGLPQQGD